MPLDLQIIRATDFVRLGARNHLDFNSSREALEMLATACRKRGIDRALLDLRELPIPEKPLFTPSQLAELVETFRHVGFGRNQRLAVLYKLDPHHGARMFAFISAMRGWQVRAFAEFEAALLWLSKEEATRKEVAGVPVAVRIAGRKLKVKEPPIPITSIPNPKSFPLSTANPRRPAR